MTLWTRLESDQPTLVCAYAGPNRREIDPVADEAAKKQVE